MKPRPPAMAKGVREAVIHELAATPKGKLGSKDKIAAHWGVTRQQVDWLAHSAAAKVDNLRGIVADHFFLLAGQAAGEISKAMADPVKMAATPLRDLAMTAEKLTNAGVTAADGHKPLVTLNFGDILARKERFESEDRLIKEMRAAKGREVSP